MEERVRNVRSYKKTPVIAVPEIPQYFQLLLPSESTSTSSPPSTLVNLQESPSTTSLSPLGSPFDLLMDGSSSQPRLRQSQQSDKQKLNLINAPKQDVWPKDRTLSYFPPLFVAQVLRVHTDHLPSNAFLNHICQSDPSLSCFAQGFVAVRESRDIEFWQFENLESREYNR